MSISLIDNIQTYANSYFPDLSSCTCAYNLLNYGETETENLKRSLTKSKSELKL